MEWGVEGSGEPNGRGYATVLNLPSPKEIKISWSITITAHPTYHYYHSFELAKWKIPTNSQFVSSHFVNSPLGQH